MTSFSRISIAFLSLALMITVTGCGGGDPGSTYSAEETSAGAATPAISEDPNEVANQMGDDYANQNR